jgi:hypothetical protein
MLENTSDVKRSEEKNKFPFAKVLEVYKPEISYLGFFPPAKPACVSDIFYF